MKLNRSGWKASDFKTLYLAFGFEEIQGDSHTKYKHKEYKQLMATVTRSSGEIAMGYATSAVNLIAEVKRLNDQNDQ